jgi:cytochrome P450
MRITTHAAVRAVLSTPPFEVPPVPAAGGGGDMRWLRATVARFSAGSDHRRRRSLAVAALAGIDPAALGHLANVRTRRILAGTGSSSFDLMSRVARPVPVALLAQALGMIGDLNRPVADAAQAYHPHTDITPAADRAVEHLVRAAGGIADESTAARIGLLIQAADATAGLIANAVLALVRHRPSAPTPAVVSEALRHDPPVRVTRRRATAPATLHAAHLPAGTVVELNLAEANRDGTVFADPDRFHPERADGDRHLSFGAGAHACPGAAHASAIAGGIVDALRVEDVRVDHVQQAPSPHLRVPATMVVRAR